MSEQSEESSSSSFNGEENLSPHVNGDSFSPEKVVHPRRSLTEENETLPDQPSLAESAIETNNVDPSFEQEEEEEEEVSGVDLLPVISDVSLDEEEEQRLTTEMENNNEFHLPTHSEEKQEDLKTQRDLDEDETVPPLDSSSSDEKDVSSSSPDLLIDEKEEDIRPLTALEDPYGIGHRVESVDLNLVEEEKSEVLIPTIELCQPSFDELSHHSMNNDDEEILPPLTSLSLALERVNDPEPIVIPTEEVLLPPRVFDVEDVLGNKTLLKRTLVLGAESGRPTRSTLATVSYRLSLVEIVSGLSLLIDEVSDERFFVGECDILPAIDICVQLMSEGERALISSDIRHCYGEKGLEEKRIPPTNKDEPNYRMNIELHLQRWSPPHDPQTLPANERLFWGDQKRQRGNFFFRREEYSNALQCYRGAHRYLDIELNPLLSSISAEERSTLIDRYIQVENNVAQVNLRLNHLESCLTATANVLRYDPQNGKALFRQGKALFQLGRYDLALQSLTKVQRVNSSDQESIQQMILTSRTKIESYHKNEKEIYKRMFQPPPPPPPSPPTSNSTRNQIEKESPVWWNYAALGGVAVALAGALIYLNRRSS